MSCDPQNNLDCFVNREWIKNNPLNKNEYVKNNFTIEGEKIQDDLASMLMNLNNRAFADFIRFKDSFFNRPVHDEKITEIIKSINAESIKELSNSVEYLLRLDISTFFIMDLSVSHLDERILTIQLSETLTLYDPNDYYTDEMERFYEVIDYVYEYFHNKIGLKLSDNKERFIKNIMKYEQIMSNVAMRPIDTLDPHSTVFTLPLHEFIDMYDHEDFWKNILGDNDMMITMYNDKYFSMFKNILYEADRNHAMSILKDNIIWGVVRDLGSYTPLFHKINSLTRQFESEQDLFLSTVSHFYGELVEDIFNAKYENREKNNKIQDMFYKMKKTARDAINRSDIFTDNSRNEALLKLDNMALVVGKAPNVYMSHISMNANFFENLIKLSEKFVQDRLSFIGRRINQTDVNYARDMVSYEINAYYEPQLNTVYIPTAMLIDCFFNLESNSAVQYGGVGAILAHEITHAFDISGSQYNHRGLLNDWLSTGDADKLIEDMKKIKQHYAKYGSATSTLGENMADILGLKIAYRTFRSSKGNKLTNDEDKLFFYSWAETFRSVAQVNYADKLNSVDVHSSFSVRINAPFSHLSEYYKVFDVQKEDKAYLPEHERSHFMD